eukprot:422945-Prymnesium_polylepis.1
MNQEGGVHGLASAVRMHLPSATSAPLKWAQSDAPSAHPALESRRCAPETLHYSAAAARARTAFRKRAS